jgi:hypothetical protein
VEGGSGAGSGFGVGSGGLVCGGGLTGLLPSATSIISRGPFASVFQSSPSTSISTKIKWESSAKPSARKFVACRGGRIGPRTIFG